MTLPLARHGRGRRIIIYKKVAANQITVQTQTGDTITYGGGTSMNIVAKDAGAPFVSDGVSVWLTN